MELTVPSKIPRNSAAPNLFQLISATFFEHKQTSSIYIMFNMAC